MKLYGFTVSPNTWKVRALAAHLKLPLDFEVIDLLKGEQFAPDYVALNPTSRTPTLVDGEFTLWESCAIMQYLASKVATPLWPNDAKARADITRWQCWELAHWGAQACGPLTFENLVKKFVAAPLFHAQGAGMPVAPYANIRGWFERVSSLPCWNETAPQMPAAA